MSFELFVDFDDSLILYINIELKSLINTIQCFLKYIFNRNTFNNFTKYLEIFRLKFPSILQTEDYPPNLRI